MTTPSDQGSDQASDNIRTVKALGLHHSAYRCRDAEETRAFWEDKVGFPLKMSLVLDEHPTTGEEVRYMHIFFDIGSHSDRQSNFLAFFDAPFRDEDDPDELFKKRWGMDLHMAIRVKDHATLQSWADHMRAQDINVEGPIDHGICTSIYFHDPNGYRWEFTTEDKAERRAFDEHGTNAHDRLTAWNKWKTEKRMSLRMTDQ